MRCDFTTFMIKSFQIRDQFSSALFPDDAEHLKNFDVALWEVGAKRHLNGTSKVNTHTHTHTHIHMDILTYRKFRPKGLMLRKSPPDLAGHYPKDPRMVPYMA